MSADNDPSGTRPPDHRGSEPRPEPDAADATDLTSTVRGTEGTLRVEPGEDHDQTERIGVTARADDQGPGDDTDSWATETGDPAPDEPVAGSGPEPPAPEPPPFGPPPSGPPPSGPPPFASTPFGSVPPGSGPGRPGRRLYRSRGQRMVAGVAGGIGEYLGVDPVLLRVVFAVLTVFGGLGVLLYLICWLVMPGQGEQFSPVDTMLGRSPQRRTGLTGETLLLVSAVVVLALFLVRHDGADYVLLAILLIIGLLVYRHLESQGPPASTDATTPPPGTPGTHSTAGQAGPAGPTGAPGAPGTAGAAQPPSASGAAGTAGFATWSSTRPWRTDPRPPHRTGGRTETTRRRSGLGMVGLCLALILAGLLVGLHQGAGLDLSRRSSLALVLALVGATLVVGTWWGRARSLILLGVPLAVVLVAAGDPLLSDWSAREQTWAPASVGELAGNYELGAGRGRLDLRDVDFTETDRTIAVELGAGELRIELPPNVDVQADGRVRVGSMDLFGSFTNGVKQARTVFDDGVDGPGGGRLEILAAVDFGRLEVVR